MSLSFTIAAGPRQRSHSQLRVPRDSWPHFLSQIRDFPNLEGHVPVVYPPETRWSGSTPRHWVSFSSPSTTRAATVEVFDPASTREYDLCKSPGQSYFTTGGLPPTSSSLRQAPWDPRPEIIFQLNSCGNSPYVATSLRRRWVCLLWICLAFRQVYISHIQHVIENILLLHYELVGGKWSAPRSSRFIPGEAATGTYWIGGWVGPRAGLDDIVRKR
jgi:hypothetical protein